MNGNPIIQAANQLKNVQSDLWSAYVDVKEIANLQDQVDRGKIDISEAFSIAVKLAS